MIKFEEGKFYRTADGRKFGPARLRNDRIPDARGKIWILDIGGGKSLGYVASDDGRFAGCAQNYPSCDLVEEWRGSDTGVFYETTNRKIVYGTFGRVEVLDIPVPNGKVAIRVGVGTGAVYIDASDAHHMSKVFADLAKALGND